MKSNKLILIAGSVVSFVVIFFAMAFAMGLMKKGPAPLIQTLMGKAPVEARAPGADSTATPDTGSVAGKAGTPAATATGAEAASPAASGEPLATPQELPIEQKSQGDGEFLSRAEALTRIEEALQTRQQQMDEEKTHLLKLQKEIEETNQRLDSLEDDAVNHLARVYGSMRPEAAAQIMMRLPTNLQTEIVAKMEDKSAGKLLGAMDPRVAAQVSASLGRRKK